MSWEGYYQNVCENGHLWETGGYAYEEDKPCPSCGKPVAFCNVVDDTNFDEVGIIPDFIWETLLKTPAVFETCNLGHKHLKKEATYRIPSEEELPELRFYRDEKGNYLLLSDYEKG